MKFILNALKLILGLIVIIFFAGVISGSGTSHPEIKTASQNRYIEKWSDYPLKQISMTLAQGNAHGCACYDHKQAKIGGSEFLVRCGCDPSEYKFYTVWTGINKIMGPYFNENEAL